MWYSIIFTDVLVGMLASVKIEPDKLDAIIDVTRTLCPRRRY